VLSEHSILKHSAARSEFSADDAGFIAGLDAAFQPGASLSALLFGVRARGLVADDDGRGAAYLSGLLIGSEVASVGSGSDRIVLLASGGVAGLYGAAMQRARLDFRTADAEDATRRGLLRAAQVIWG